MTLLNYDNIEKCYVSGPIHDNIMQFLEKLIPFFLVVPSEEIPKHPKEIERQERMGTTAINNRLEALHQRRRKSSNVTNYNDSVILVASNCGIGLKSKEYYHSLFGKFNSILEKNNCHLLFVRGNQDNPSYYEDNLLNFSNIICVKDYTVVKCKNFNILCIGGGISVDRTWKQIQEKRINKKLYYENENVTYDEKEIDDITSHYQISAVVTCTNPSFTFPTTNNFMSTKWTVNDSSLSSELTKERMVMDRIYNKLMLTNKPYVWFYGKYNQFTQNSINDILFVSLCDNRIIMFNNLVEDYFGVSISKKISKNTNSSDKFIKFISSRMTTSPLYFDMEDWEIGGGLERIGGDLGQNNQEIIRNDDYDHEEIILPLDVPNGPLEVPNGEILNNTIQ